MFPRKDENGSYGLDTSSSWGWDWVYVYLPWSLAPLVQDSSLQVKKKKTHEKDKEGKGKIPGSSQRPGQSDREWQAGRGRHA